MKLNPDLKLLESIGIIQDPLDTLFRGGPMMEVDDGDFEALRTFLVAWGAVDALHELAFFQANFVDKPPRDGTKKMIKEHREYLQSREKLLGMDFSKLQGIKLHFGKDDRGKGINANLPKDLLQYIGGLILSELESEAPQDASLAGKIEELKEIEKRLNHSKSKMKDSFSRVEAILKAKTPGVQLEQKQVLLCTYAIFFQCGYRLYSKENSPYEDHEVNPFSGESFMDWLVYDNLRK